jgi:hypothetical protein
MIYQMRLCSRPGWLFSDQEIRENHRIPRRRLGSQDAIVSPDGYGGGRGKVPALFLFNCPPPLLRSFSDWFLVKAATRRGR